MLFVLRTARVKQLRKVDIPRPYGGLQTSLHDDLLSLTARRLLLQQEEHRLVADAINADWSYTAIARTLGISRQAVTKMVRSPTLRRSGAEAIVAREQRQQLREIELTETIEAVLGPLEQRPWYRRMFPEPISADSINGESGGDR